MHNKVHRVNCVVVIITIYLFYIIKQSVNRPSNTTSEHSIKSAQNEQRKCQRRDIHLAQFL